jgi:hypothetical protein
MNYTSDIDELIFTVDENGNVKYTEEPNKPNPTPATPATGDKKWWEAALGILPALVTSIFGGNSANANPIYTPPLQQQNPNNNNIIIIALAAVVIVFLLLKKK